MARTRHGDFPKEDGKGKEAAVPICPHRGALVSGPGGSARLYRGSAVPGLGRAAAAGAERGGARLPGPLRAAGGGRALRPVTSWEGGGGRWVSLSVCRCRLQGGREAAAAPGSAGGGQR